MWTKEELQEMDQRTRKLISVSKALYQRDDIDRLMCQKEKDEDDLPAFKIT